MAAEHRPLREDEVRTIAAIADPVARNEQITNAYRRLSRDLCYFIGGPFANWCTYAVWSSRTVGGALAGRDLPIRAQQLLQRAVRNVELRDRITDRLKAALPTTRTTYAVPLANGNRDIFIEVGTSFTRFLDQLGDDDHAHEEHLDAMLTTIVGEELDQMASAAPSLLREGLRQYYAARFANTGDERSELLLAGSLLVGAYEQRRVQDDVVASFAIGVEQVLGPLAKVAWVRSFAEPRWARLMTKQIMSLVIDGDVIALGQPINAPPGAASLYPATLAHVDSPALAKILDQYDPEPGQPVIATDWSDYDDRMRFITAFFRSRQQSGGLFADGDLEGRVVSSGLTLGAARAVGDPEADAVVAAFAAEHPDIAVRDLVATMAGELHRAPDRQHPLVRDYFGCGPDLPSWADAARIQQGQQFFQSHGPLIGASLFCGSLPEAYAAADGVEVLAVTSELISHPRRRIAETGQFVVDVMALDGGEGTDAVLGLGKGGAAYRSVRGVRLMHAAVRALVTDRLGDEWVAEHGVPVNQQDLVGTLLTFTTVVYRSLDVFGIEYSADDADAHLHAWCVVGTLLGIDEGLLPWSRAEADELAALLRVQLRKPSAAGTTLALALLHELEEAMPMGALKVPRTVMRHLIGDPCADLLQLPPAAWWRPVLRPLGDLDEVGGSRGPGSTTARTISRLVGRAMFGEYIARGVRGERVPFVIPADVSAAWRLKPARQDRRTQRRRRRIQP